MNQLIEKQDELINHMSLAFAYQADGNLVEYWKKKSKLESELSTLKQQGEAKEEMQPDKEQLYLEGIEWLRKIIGLYQKHVQLLQGVIEKNHANVHIEQEDKEKLNAVINLAKGFHQKADEFAEKVNNYHSASTTMSKWISVEERLPEIGIECIGFNPEWIDEDYNPKGIRLWFHDDLGYYSARYNNTMDCWDTVEDETPAHWMPLPEAPNSKSLDTVQLCPECDNPRNKHKDGCNFEHRAD